MLSLHRAVGIYVVSILLASPPFAFAVIRAIRTGDDLRYLWVAIASLLGAAVVMAIGKARGRTSAGVLALAAGALAVATLLAVAAAVALGLRATPVVWAIALGFSLCCTGGLALPALARAFAAGSGRRDNNPQRTGSPGSI
jgi:hypothetical protein